jgi:hypothetical protein
VTVSKKIKSEGMKLGMKAMSKLMESPDRAEKVMKAVEQVQRSRERVDETAARLLNLSQLPSKEDIRDLSRQAGRLRRETKKILAALDDLEDGLDRA